MVRTTITLLLLGLFVCNCPKGCGQADAMPSYEWVDVERIHTGTGVSATIRLVYNSSAPDDSEHTYRLTAAGGLWNIGSCTEAEVYAADLLGGDYVFDFGFVQGGTSYSTAFVTHDVPNPTPSDWITTDQSQVVDLRAVAWGPERQDQNADNEHEPRESITVRISWAGGGTSLAGTWTGDLVPNANDPFNYRLTVPDAVFDTNGNGYTMTPSLTFQADDSIVASTGMTAGPATSSGIWGAPAGSGDYTGPLTREDGNSNGYAVYEYVILAQGPTVDGPGNDGIDPDDGGGDGGDDGGGDGGGDGGDDGGDVEPEPLPEEPELEDCWTDKFDALQEILPADFLTRFDTEESLAFQDWANISSGSNGYLDQTLHFDMSLAGYNLGPALNVVWGEMWELARNFTAFFFALCAWQAIALITRQY